MPRMLRSKSRLGHIVAGHSPAHPLWLSRWILETRRGGAELGWGWGGLLVPNTDKQP